MTLCTSIAPGRAIIARFALDVGWAGVDLNAAEQEARMTIEAFATGLRIGTESNPVAAQKYLKHRR